jgi:urease accessory protein
MKARLGIAALVAALAVCSPVWAHHEGSLSSAGGFAAGLAHPWFGLDHLLAMVAVGLLAAQMRGRALWLLPAAFLGMMIVGGALGMAGYQPPYIETGIALSVVALGAAVAWGSKYPLAAATACVGMFGLIHGHAHGAEMPALAAPALYACGFLAATALLHAVGVASGVALVGHRRWAALVRWSGAGITCAGLMMLVGTV